MPAKPLNDHELAEAAQLKRLLKIWQDNLKDKGEPSSQEVVAAQLGFGQSAMSQYINGKIPMNVEAATAFARELGVKVDQFSPMVAEKIRYAASMIDGVSEHQPTSPKWMDKEAYELLEAYYSLNKRQRMDILRDIKDLSSTGEASTVSNKEQG